MSLKGLSIGFALCGSFCTFDKVILEIEKLVNLGANVVPIMSTTAFSTDTRFGNFVDINKKIEEICKNEILATITVTEPIGPKKMFDALVVAPCTGNTLAKLAASITDTPVTMAVKSHLRNERPVVIAVSTNDGLRGSAKNIGALLNYKNIYFVPFSQDDFIKKPYSLVADMTLIDKTVEKALCGVQIQPIIK